MFLYKVDITNTLQANPTSSSLQMKENLSSLTIESLAHSKIGKLPPYRRSTTPARWSTTASSLCLDKRHLEK